MERSLRCSVTESLCPTSSTQRSGAGMRVTTQGAQLLTDEFIRPVLAGDKIAALG